MSDRPPREILEDAIACFGQPERREEYFRLYSGDIILHGYQGVEPGIASVKNFYHAFWKAFPEAQVSIEDLIEQSNTLVARYVITGTLHEPLFGAPPRGQHIQLPGISILHFRREQCFERWTCSDSLLLMAQIGGTFPSAK